MYKKLIFTFIAFFFCVEELQAQMENLQQLQMSVPGGSLTLEQARQMALDASPSVQQATARIEAAREVVAQAGSQLKPMVTATLGGRFQNSTIQPDWQPEIRFNDSFRIWSAGLEANWLLFDGFARRASILAAQYQVEASEKTRLETRRLLADAVSSAFFQAQLAVESMVIAKQNQEFNRTLEEEADIRYRTGSIPESEKLNFSVRALQAETDYLQAEQSFSLVATVLAELLALPDAKLPENLYPVRSNSQVQTAPVPTYETEIAYALENRPDLQALKASLAALTEKKKMEEGNYWPKLVLNSGLEYNKYEELDSGDQEEHDAWAGLHLSWDIYQGGRDKARVREAAQEVRALQFQKTQQELDIESSIRQAIATAAATRAMYKRQQQSLQLTKKIREHIEKSYRAGVAKITRLNEAQTDLVRAAGAEAASRINYLLALEKIRSASGRLQ